MYVLISTFSYDYMLGILHTTSTATLPGVFLIRCCVGWTDRSSKGIAVPLRNHFRVLYLSSASRVRDVRNSLSLSLILSSIERLLRGGSPFDVPTRQMMAWCSLPRFVVLCDGPMHPHIARGKPSWLSTELSWNPRSPIPIPGRCPSTNLLKPFYVPPI